MCFKKWIPYLFSIAVIFLFAGIATPVFAHSTGASWHATSTPYTIDVGYDPVQFIAGEYTRFDFTLEDEKTGDARPYAQVWVRVVRGSDTMLATGLFHQPVGPTTLLYSFAEPGAYTLETNYRKSDGEEMATVSFPIVVDATQTNPSSPLFAWLLPFITGCIAGMLGLYARQRFLLHARID
jgi:hypothetical protein